MPWLDTGIESGIWLSTDMPWLDTGIESGNCSCRYALAGYRYRIYNQSLTDMPWLDTGIEYGIVTVDSNHLWIVLFPKKARHQLYAMS